MPQPVVCLVSFRLGGTDGVSVEAAKWATAFEELGFTVRTVAGAGTADVVLPGLAIDAAEPPTAAEVDDALAAADLVVVENLCSLPLNPPAGALVASALAGRRTVLHHHDLPWQRPRFIGSPPPPHDAAWAHVTINAISRFQLEAFAIPAYVLRNTFEVDTPLGDRTTTRLAMGFDENERVVMQPTRALERKRVGTAIALAEALHCTYWLLGPAEDGYDDELRRLLADARCRVVHAPPPGAGSNPGTGMAGAYAAAELVALPSSWEGFGNPTVESAVHRRPLAVSRYPVARELEAFGFRWFDPDDVEGIRQHLADTDPMLESHNHGVARRHFDIRDLPGRLRQVFEAQRWPW